MCFMIMIDVFYDHDGLSSGPFAETLYRRIDECTDFLVVLSPGGLDRCADPTDWVRNGKMVPVTVNNL